jgi:predicted nucleic acid-binding protein
MVKRYLREQGSEETFEWWRMAESVASTDLCFVEVHAALAKAVRVGWVEDLPARRQAQRWVQDWSALLRIAVQPPVLRMAAELAWRRGLRGYDSVHLASALVWRDAAGASVTLATFDGRLWDAALEEGVRVLPEARP